MISVSKKRREEFEYLYAALNILQTKPAQPNQEFNGTERDE